ncbi:hypothetical protein CAPTEDRAFT_220138 [Capitella teleta]|uniref:F-box domain-containing protein n=1 Tax=Capitella teleta TaxID=283909 RepID=R7UTF4_CAPTE|nr:hypothetical protein CAPTEDRAFT_220138 [Capitella teleta]|eukprot:ELU06661.1 hypothetical protein CAPTEDRAFT_220138 [Capitella teleta]
MLTMSNAISVDALHAWELLPDDLIFLIFNHLPACVLIKASEVCKRWHRIAQDEFLWRDLLILDWKVPPNTRLPLKVGSWRQEYKRLFFHAPLVESEVLDDHSDQVLHVSYSHNGQLFATSSKDCHIKVWQSDYPAYRKFNVHMKNLNWKYTQFSQFNQNDTLLLVSGVYDGPFNFFGEIAVFTISPDSFQLLNRVRNDPFDVFGTWYNETCLISGNLLRLGHLNSSCYLWLNRAMRSPQATGDPFLRLFNFRNRNASSVRTIQVAKCQRKGQECNATNCCCGKCDETPAPVLEASGGDGDRLFIFTTGTKCCSPHQIGIKRILEADTAHLSSQRLKPELKGNDDMVDGAKFDAPDHLIEMHGHIIGMCLSQDNRYLYVNSRPWPQGAEIQDPLNAPPIAQEIDIHVIDLWKMRDLGVCHRAHKAYTPNDECFFIFLDVSDLYVASGAEDHHGYLWDRHWGVCLQQYNHDDVVNCVAFNPCDSEVLVTVSDDNKVKIWRSRNRRKLLASTRL